MKLKNVIYAILIIFGLAFCTSKDDELRNEVDSVVSLENSFDVTYLTSEEKNSYNLDQLIPVSYEEALNILQEIKNPKEITKIDSIVVEKEDSIQLSIVTESNLCIDNKHVVSLQLNLISYIDDNSLFYKNSSINSESLYYLMKLTGFSLISNKLDGTYNFEGIGNLYLKIEDNSVKYIQVKFRLMGFYDPNNHNINIDSIYI